MLRSFEQLCHTATENLLIAADDGHASLANSGAYAKPWHWHDCVMFILPSRGAIELKHEDRREGTWLSHDRFAVVPSNRAHKTRAGIGANSHVALYATGAMLHRLDNEIGSLSEFHRRTRAAVLVRRTSTIRALQELSLRSDDGTYGHAGVKRSLSTALLVQCIAEVIAGDMMPNVSKREHGMALVADLKEYLTLHADEDIPLDALGERFGVSRRHITRLFRDGTGFSVGEFQQHVRLQTARELLSGTDLPIGEIAFRVGFDSGAALAHAMRRSDGRSPSDIRKSASPPLQHPRATRARTANSAAMG
jgi:AraC-like DNA-binding protein